MDGWMLAINSVQVKSSFQVAMVSEWLLLLPEEKLAFPSAQGLLSGLSEVADRRSGWYSGFITMSQIIFQALGPAPQTSCQALFSSVSKPLGNVI